MYLFCSYHAFRSEKVSIGGKEKDSLRLLGVLLLIDGSDMLLPLDLTREKVGSLMRPVLIPCVKQKSLTLVR